MNSEVMGQDVVFPTTPFRPPWVETEWERQFQVFLRYYLFLRSRLMFLLGRPLYSFVGFTPAHYRSSGPVKKPGPAARFS